MNAPVEAHPGWPAGLALILAVCRLDQEATLPRLRELLVGPLDAPGILAWQEVLRQANHHEVIPLFYTRLRSLAGRDELAGSIPAATLASLKSLFLAVGLRNQRLAHSLLDCLDLLEGEGIAALPFKGLALAVQAYGDPSLRQFLDLDVLVHEQDAGRAFEALQQVGWQPEFDLRVMKPAWLVRSAYHLRFERARPFKAGEEPGGDPTLGVRDGLPPRRKDVLEVHWTIADRSHIHPLQAEMLWQTPAALQLEGRELPTLAPEKALLAACIHGASNQWQMLKWIADVAHLVQANPNLDWEAFLGHARRLGFERVVLGGLFVAQQACGLALPREIEIALPANAQVAQLARQVLQETLPAQGHPGMLSNNRYYLRSRERLRDRLYYIYDQAFVPKPVDWETVRLPAALYPLYYLLRPARLAAKVAASLVHRLMARNG